MRLPSVKNAVLLHFGVSLAIFLALVYVMMRLWYPGALFEMDGGVQGLTILAPIDLVLGPMLTLLFYRPHKRSVVFDMSFIAIVQVAALSYGVFSVYQQRPVALVFAQERFETLSHSDYQAALAAADVANPTPLSQFGPSSPRLIYAQSYTPNEYGQYLADLLNGKPELRERIDRHLPMSAGRHDIEQHKIAATQASDGKAIEIPAKHPPTIAVTEEDHYPLQGRYGTAVVVLNPKTLEMRYVTAASAE